MRRYGLVCTLVLLSPLLIAMIPMPPLDVAGDWNLELTVQLPGEVAGTCDFGGYAQVVQDGNQFSGTAHLFLVSGDPACPTEMSANISGTVANGVIETGMLEGGNLGTASFTGSLLAKAQGPMTGGTTVLTGPFAGAMGVWTALVGNAVIAIPILDPVGLALLVGLILASGLVFLYRGRFPT